LSKFEENLLTIFWLEEKTQH